MIISTTGTAVVSIRASDPDGDDFTFVIENQPPAEYFTVSSNGDVTVANGQIPDREVRSNYRFCSQHVIVHTFVILMPWACPLVLVASSQSKRSKIKSK